MIVVRRERKIKESANFSLPLIALVAGGTYAATRALSNPRTREYLKKETKNGKVVAEVVRR